MEPSKNKNVLCLQCANPFKFRFYFHFYMYCVCLDISFMMCYCLAPLLDIRCICSCNVLTSLRDLILEDMFIPTLSHIWLENPGIDWIPPAMCTLNNNLQIVWIDVHVVFLSIIANNFPDFFFHCSRNSMFACIHVSDLRLL